MSSPLQMSLERPERASRLQLFFGFLLVLFRLIVLGIKACGSGFVTMLACFAILFTGKYPRRLWEFNKRSFFSIQQLTMYLSNMTDKKPSYSLDDVDKHPLQMELPYPAKSSRLKLFIAPLLLIPHFVGMMFRGMKMGLLCAFYAFWVILFTGTYPQYAWDYTFRVNKLLARMGAYLLHLTDERPINTVRE